MQAQPETQAKLCGSAEACGRKSGERHAFPRTLAARNPLTRKRRQQLRRPRAQVRRHRCRALRRSATCRRRGPRRPMDCERRAEGRGGPGQHALTTIAHRAAGSQRRPWPGNDWVISPAQELTSGVAARGVSSARKGRSRAAAARVHQRPGVAPQPVPGHPAAQRSHVCAGPRPALSPPRSARRGR